MKNLQFICVLLLLFLFCACNLIGQICPDSKITLAYQQDIDNFSTSWPNCTEFDVDIEINEIGPITDLSGLIQIKKINGSLIIHNNDSLSSIEGLDSLSSISGNLIIFSNDQLTDLTGLESIQYIGGNVELKQNSLITDLTGLEKLITINGDFILRYNQSLINLDALSSLESIGKTFRLVDNNNLQSCITNSVLTRVKSLFALSNDNLVDLTGLETLEFVDSISIEFSRITDFPRFNLIDSLHYLSIRFNRELKSFHSFQNLKHIKHSLRISDNELLNDFFGLSS